MSKGKWVLGIAVCITAPLFAGCATAPGVVRGQSPMPGDMQPAVTQASLDGCPGGCPDGACDNCDCRGGCCLPKHALWYHYTGPVRTCCLDGCCCGRCCLGSLVNYGLGHDGPLVYPPNPTPGALVQYPYYICKGPDDFFLDTSSTRH